MRLVLPSLQRFKSNFKRVKAVLSSGNRFDDLLQTGPTGRQLFLEPFFDPMQNKVPQLEVGLIACGRTLRR